MELFHGAGGGEALVHFMDRHRIREVRAKQVDKAPHSCHGFAFITIHMEGKSHHKVFDLTQSRKFGDAAGRPLGITGGNGFERMGQQPDIVTDRQPDSGGPVIHSHRPYPAIHGFAAGGRGSEQLAGEAVNQLFDVVRLLAARHKNGITCLNDNQSFHAKQSHGRGARGGKDDIVL